MNASERPAAAPDEAAHIAELARLLPAAASQSLPNGRHQVLKEHIMREIASTSAPKRFLTRRLVLGAVPAAVAATLVIGIGVIAVSDHHGTTGQAGSGKSALPGALSSEQPTEAAPLLLRIAAVAATEESPTVRDNQFVYVESMDAYLRMTLPEGTASVDPPHRRQVWLSVDGTREGWLIEAATPDDFRNGTSLGTNSQPSLNAPTYRYLESLPTDPSKLLEKIYKETEGQGPGPDQEAFVTIGDLIRESIVPPQLASALYQAAARIPGVEIVQDAVDSTGRHGIAVARTDSAADERTEWIFNNETLEFLGERTVQLRDGDGIKAGTVTGSSAVITRGFVDQVRQIPTK